MDIVNIVVRIPDEVDVELSGVKILDQAAFPFIQTCDTAGDVPLPGNFNNGIHHGLYIPATHRTGVDGTAVELGKQHEMIAQDRSSLPSPQVKVGKGIFTAPSPTPEQEGIVYISLRQLQRLKIDHNLSHPLMRL